MVTPMATPACAFSGVANANTASNPNTARKPFFNIFPLRPWKMKPGGGRKVVVCKSWLLIKLRGRCQRLHVSHLRFRDEEDCIRDVGHFPVAGSTWKVSSPRSRWKHG